MSKVKITETRVQKRTYSHYVPEGIGADLIRFRMATGFSPAALAKLAGMPVGTIYRIEAGRYTMGPRSLAKLNAALNRNGYEAIRIDRIQKKSK